MQFKIGDKAVYPAHGVGVIKRIESRKIGGQDVDFYVLQILSSGATLMVPALACDRHGMRPIASQSLVDQAYGALMSPSRVTNTTWNRRFREFNDLLRNGSLLATAEVLRDLVALRHDKDLSYGEKKMLDKALSMLVSEVSLATNRNADDVETEIKGYLSL